ncbi:beta-galactosidase 17 isoform X2 [Wolffia australiana]
MSCGIFLFVCLFLSERFFFSVGISSENSTAKDGYRSFIISDDMFWKDGEPFRIIGGDLHYFRVVPQYWEDRLVRAKALGLNTIQTYVPWNLHEPKPRRWVFEGIADIEYFLKIAQELELQVMLRVGPYICAEWDLGGFPAWLLAVEPALKLRSSDPDFLQLVTRWWDVLLPKVVPYLYKNGGPVIMVQIENEFGSYGYDWNYLGQLVDCSRRHLGEDVVLYTTDGATRDTLLKGTIPGKDVFAAVDFSTGEDPAPIFDLQRKFNGVGKSPPLSTEFYTGWLTHWGEKNAETEAEFTARELEKILSLNASVVLYMAHGGTNFGFYNGANMGQADSDYKPDLTSYDYDAPIKEDGDVENLKFRAIRSVIETYTGRSLPPIPPNNERRGYGTVKATEVASFFAIIHTLHDPTEVVVSERPLAMELVGQMFGFLLYESEFLGGKDSLLSIPKIHDRAQVFVSCPGESGQKNPTTVGVIERWSNRELVVPALECPSDTRMLLVLVENMGRVNYGPYLYDRKGILSHVMLGSDVLKNWRMTPLSFTNLSSTFQANAIARAPWTTGPGFYLAHLTIDEEEGGKDTFISLDGWNKGVVFVNDFNLGRFWTTSGPQCTLYVPSSLLHKGLNSVVIFELHDPHPGLVVRFVDRADFSCGSQLLIS